MIETGNRPQSLQQAIPVIKSGRSEYLKTLEVTIAIIGLLYFIVGQFRINQLVPSAAISALLKYAIWFSSLAFLVIRPHRTIRTAMKAKAILGLSFLCVVSFVWSDFPELTLERISSYMQMFTFSLYVASRFGSRQSLNLLVYALTITVLSSLFMAIALPSLGTHVHEGNIVAKGIFIHKNTLGVHMVLSSLLYLEFLLYSKGKSIFYAAGLLLSILLILLATSKSALGNLLVGIAAVFFYNRLRAKGKLLVIIVDFFLLILIPTVFIIATNWFEILESIGRDPTLTGRTYIWEYALESIKHNYLLGHGYSTFWIPGIGNASEASRQYFQGVWVPPHGHNAFIDVLLSTGIFGLLFLVISFVSSYFGTLRNILFSRRLEDMWHLALLHFLIIYSMTETIIVTETSVFWPVYMISIFSRNQPLNLKTVEKISIATTHSA